MLKKSLLVLAPLFVAAIPLTGMSAEGTINFIGEIGQSTCTASTTSKNLNVTIGKYAVAQFPTVGSVSPAKDFTLDLTSCPLSTNLTLRFDGTQVTGQPDLLQVNVAKNVGIEVLDTADKVIGINKASATPSIFTTDASGAASVKLKARYKAFAVPVVAGEANATATFSITYP